MGDTEEKDTEKSADAGNTTNVWDTAIDKVRQTALWVGTALAAVATVIFGGGPLLRGFKGDEVDFGRWCWIIGGLVTGVGGILWLIASIVRVQLPRTTSLLSVPAKIGAHTKDQLPKLAGEDHATMLEFTTDRERAAPIALGLARKALATSEADLQSARDELSALVRADPIRPADIAATRVKIDALTKQLADQSVRVHDLETRAATLDRAATTMLDVVRFESVRTEFRNGFPAMLVSALMAVIGAVVYLGFLGPEDKESDAATPASSAAVVATVTPVGAAGQEFLTALGIPGTCTLMMVTGDGTESAPYSLQPLTAAEPSCPLISFQARDEHVAVAKPTPSKVTVTFTPGPDRHREGHIWLGVLFGVTGTLAVAVVALTLKPSKAVGA